MELLKVTSTFDPSLADFIEAKIFTDGKNIYMQKNGCADKVIIENDPVLYKLLNVDCTARSQIDHLVLEPTYECNLQCPVCFVHGQKGELSVNQIKELVSKYKNKIISISGGEPTMRKDLEQIIKIVSRQNIALLATNGLKLNDYNYLLALKRSGLKYVTFSMNGFSDSSYLKTNAKILTKDKLGAVDNLLKSDFRFLLSMLLLRGVNENEIKDIVLFSAKNSRNIKEIRIRSMSTVGKYPLQVKPFFISEILELFCDNLGLCKKDIYKELLFKRILSDTFPNFVNFQRSCGFSFHLKLKGNSVVPVGKFFNVDIGSFIPLINKLWQCRDIYPVSKKLLSFLSRRFSSIWYHGDHILKVSIRCWPTLETLDYNNHIQRCGSRYLGGIKDGFPVCYANIVQNTKRL